MNNTFLTRLMLSLLLLLCSVHGNAANDRTLFWKVESADTTVYLLGSIHFANDSYYPLREQIQKAFTGSDALAVELDATRVNPYDVQDWMNDQGSYWGFGSIQDHISKLTYLRLTRVLQNLEIPVNSVRKLKPGILVMVMSGAVAESIGYDAKKGIDMHFLEQAHATDKPVIELESMESQLKVLANLPQGAAYLEYSIDSISRAETEMNIIEQAWKAGDEAVLRELMFDEPEAQFPGYSEVNEVFIYARNNKMTQKIRGFMEQKANVFVIVGAAHLIGKRGIVQQLKNAGYKVTRL